MTSHIDNQRAGLAALLQDLAGMIDPVLVTSASDDHLASILAYELAQVVHQTADLLALVEAQRAVAFRASRS